MEAATQRTDAGNRGFGALAVRRGVAALTVLIAVGLALPVLAQDEEDDGAAAAAEDAAAGALYGAMHGACIGRLRQQPAHPKINVVRSIEAQLKTAANWGSLSSSQRRSVESGLGRYLASGRPGPGEDAPRPSSKRGAQCVKLCQVLYPLGTPGWEDSRAGCYGMCGS